VSYETMSDRSNDVPFTLPMQPPHTPEWRAAAQVAFFILLQIAAKRSRRFQRSDAQVAQLVGARGSGHSSPSAACPAEQAE
jgi:hypothetical protein